MTTSEGMRVLSLFDGMSCGRYVLSKLNIPITQYIASEVDKWAILISQKNFPDTIQMGDVRGVRQLAEVGALGEVDLLIGGSPCQNLSFAGKQDGFSVDIHTLDEYKRLVAEGFEFKGQSYLFWEYVWIKELLQPKWFLLENVRMKKEYLKIFNDVMGVEGVFINSALVSAQNRQRYYWCNWQVDQPEDRGLLLRDVLESGAVDREKSYCIDVNYYKGGSVENYKRKARRQIVGIAETKSGYRPYKDDGRKGSLSEIGTIATPDHCTQTITSTHTPKVTTYKVGEVKGGGIGNRIYDVDGKAIALSSQSGGTAGNGNMLIHIKDKSNTLTTNKGEGVKVQQIVMRQRGRGNNSGFEKEVDECPSLTSSRWEQNHHIRFTQSEKRPMLTEPLTYRKLTPIECERLQGLPGNYTEGVSNPQRHRMLGNGWQCDTIEHIFMQAILRDEIL